MHCDGYVRQSWRNSGTIVRSHDWHLGQCDVDSGGWLLSNVGRIIGTGKNITSHSEISHDLDCSVLPERSTVDGESIWHTTCALLNLSQMQDISPSCYPNNQVGISDVNHGWAHLSFGVWDRGQAYWVIISVQANSESLFNVFFFF